MGASKMSGPLVARDEAYRKYLDAAGEGIIGMTYSIKGNAEEPSVSVNPLSMVTPGILRRIFEGRMPDAANAPSNAKPAPVTVTPQSPGATAPQKPTR